MIEFKFTLEGDVAVAVVAHDWVPGACWIGRACEATIAGAYLTFANIMHINNIGCPAKNVMTIDLYWGKNI